MDYIIADLHLGHANIIKYCDRPFANVQEMDKTIIENWNKVITYADTVFVLGDFALSRRDKVIEYINVLKGNKILIMGNHDKRVGSATWWLNAGFDSVHKSPQVIKSLQEFFLLSHEPQANSEMINIHGHIHNKKLSKDFDPTTHICVSAELLDYTPLRIT